MKKRRICLCLAVLCGCFMIAACNKDKNVSLPPYTQEQEDAKQDPITSGGNFDAGENYGEQEDGEETVVTPIVPGGNYDGGDYGD